MNRELRTVQAGRLWDVHVTRPPRKGTVTGVCRPEQEGDNTPGGGPAGAKGQGHTAASTDNTDERGRGPQAGHGMNPRPCSERGVTRSDCSCK